MSGPAEIGTPLQIALRPNSPRMDHLRRVLVDAKSQRCLLRDQTAARSSAERDDSVVFSFGKLEIAKTLFLAHSAGHVIANFSWKWREPRSSQKLNMKSDEVRDLASHQTRGR